jgi:Spy/CpxP family protein refolding chaperone
LSGIDLTAIREEQAAKEAAEALKREERNREELQDMKAREEALAVLTPEQRRLLGLK